MNKTLKKTLSIILAILMIVTSVPFAFAAGDGVPLTIDVTDKSYVEIGNGRDYYDEDGYILTGTTSGYIEVLEACNVTLNNVAASYMDFRAPDNSVINIAFEGTNEMADRVSLYKEHLVFEGSDDATFKASYFYNGGNSDSSVTVNGGNMVLETVGQSINTVLCGNFIINDGTVTASNDSYHVINSSVKLNGGTLNVIGTSASYAAIADDIIMNKDTLLTVSGTYGLIVKDYGNIFKADGLTESDYFFVRYDTESEFAPVYDIKAALDGKTYAEIKIDTHEHSFENGKCICGYACPHESITDNKCDDCGAEGTIVTIEMTDSYGDGWNGNAVVIKHLVDGVYTEEGTATIEYGENGILTAILLKDSIYTFNWVAGAYSDECNFAVVVDGETVYRCVDGSTLTDGQLIYTFCQHDLSNKDGICAKGCGYSCPHENVTDGKCGVCGYECPHIDDVEKHFCTECGITVSECADENGDNICDICNALIGAPEISVGGIYVDGSNYTDILGDADEGATAYYVLETNTLVLDGFNYEGEDCGITCNGSLNIEVKGENKIVAVDGLCIYAEDDAVLNIGGTGKLDIEAIENGIYADSANDTDENIEINVKDSVTLNVNSETDGVDIDSNNDIKLTVNENSTLNIKAISEGVVVSSDSNSVEILVKDNGTFTVDGEDECIYIVDTAKATVTFTDNAKVSLVNNDEEGIYISAIESGTVNVSGNADVYIAVDEESIEADVVTVDGGSLKAHGGNGYPGIYVAEVTVNAGKLIVSSEDEKAISADSIKITGGTLVAGNNTAEYPVFSVAPDFSEYNSEYMVLASEKADATYLVEYDSANAENYRVITIQCKHELDGNVCKKCGFECGVDCSHYLEEGAACAICGSIVYAITHQPTEAEPYVGLSDDTDAFYQWYTVEENTSEITDENAATVSYTWGESSYDKETGWTGVPYEEDYSGQDFFTVAMKAGETVTVEVTGDFFSGVGLYDYDTDNGVWKDAQEGVTTYELTVESDGNYTFYTYVNSGVVTVKAFKTAFDKTAIDGETSAELKNPVIGNKHFCEVTFADGTTEMSDVFEYAYAITHQPTSGEPYVELNDDTDASYQWYEVERRGPEITDENADTVVYDWGESSYDKETGWTGVAYEENITGQDFFTVALKAGETVIVELTGDFTEGVGLWDYNTNYGVLIEAEEGVSSYEITVGADGDYTFYTFVNSGVVTVKAYTGVTNYIAIEGEASAEIKNPEIGKRYVCEVTYGNGTTEMTDVLKYSYAITHQPTSEEPYVELNDDTDASYQWYTVEDDAEEITDENAKTSTGTYSAEYGWSPMIEASSSTQYYFSFDIKAGEKVSFEFSSVPEIIKFSDFIVRPEETTFSYVAELDRTYELIAYYDGTEITARAYLGDATYTAIEGENSAELKNADIGKKYACEVTFGNGTTEMSEVFEVTKLHNCDFTGEWKYDADKHWKECACGLLSEEGTHTGGEATCIAKAVCETCGEEYGEVDSDAHDIVIDEAVAPKCGETGLTEGQHCSRCDAMTIIQEVVPALTHKDDDGDSLCDHGCGTQISSGSNGGTGEAETPDGPEQPEEDETICEHCGGNHSNPITRIFCRITQFFLRLFTFLGYWE